MENGKKTISCSYGVLVIILCATVAFLTNYILIDRKINEGKGSLNNCTEYVNSDSDISHSDLKLMSEKKYSDFAEKMISERQSKFGDGILNRSTIESKIINSTYTVELSKDGELSVIYSDELGSKVLASNVLNYFLINVGQESGKVLYFINEDGTVGKVSNIEYHRISLDDVTVEKVENLSNIVMVTEGSFSDGMSGHRGPIFIDIDGSIFLN